MSVIGIELFPTLLAKYNPRVPIRAYIAIPDAGVFRASHLVFNSPPIKIPAFLPGDHQ